MAERIIENETDEVPEFPGILQQIMLTALSDAKKKLEAGEEVVPFTALAVKDKLFVETHPGDDADQCLAYARHTVQNATGADGYALCYDGFLDTEEGKLDALIAEGGVPGELMGYAIGCLYEAPEGENAEAPKVTSDPFYIGPAPNFMMLTGVEVPEVEEAAAEDAQESETAEE